MPVTVTLHGEKSFVGPVMGIVLTPPTNSFLNTQLLHSSSGKDVHLDLTTNPESKS